MKFTIAALVSTVALAATVADAAAPKCSGGVRVRKEFRDLSAGEWSLYVSAIHTLAKKPANDGRLAKKGYSILEELVKIHVDNFGQIHDNDIFPTWHRAFIYRFETELRKVDASISLPYWAITADYEHPENAYAFSDKILGGSNPLNKQLEAGCIKNGPFQDLKYRDFGCIRRGFDAQGHVSQSIAEHNLADQFWDSTYKARLPSGPEVEAILRNAGGSWAKFLDDFNYVLHASVHSFIAGSDSGTMINQHSPADPGFWFWHAWMDSVFTEWQRRNPAAAVPYLNQGLPGLGLSAGSVHSVVDMCYSYQPAGCLNPKPVPTSTSTTTTKSTVRSFFIFIHFSI
ncbi:hypothetical protein BC828DRAFT_24247 [Blastocladiella britannica]|nr:hypothetical protein BC828DRAFT_24247 [Blastocladiella britannica]